jgi:hypothetical protein
MLGSNVRVKLFDRRLLVVVIALLVMAAFAVPASAQFERPGVLASPLHAIMTGANEAPGPGDPDGTGYARFLFNQQTGELCYVLAVQNITLPAAAAHIHRGAAGVPGPVVIPLAPPDASGMSFNCTTADSQLIGEILSNPSAFYVNVHNTDYPPGAVRGQLSVPPFWSGGM